MRLFSPARLPRDPEGSDARRDGRLLIRVAEAQWRNPATRNLVDRAALAGACADPRLSPRTRRRAAALLLGELLGPASPGATWANVGARVAPRGDGSGRPTAGPVT